MTYSKRRYMIKVFKKTLSLTIVLFLATAPLSCYSFEPFNIISIPNARSPIKVAVLLYSFDYLLDKMIRKDLENIQKENPDKIEYTFFDGKGNPDVQAQIMNDLIENTFDLFVFNVGQKSKEVMDNIFFKS